MGYASIIQILGILWMCIKCVQNMHLNQGFLACSSQLCALYISHVTLISVYYIILQALARNKGKK